MASHLVNDDEELQRKVRATIETLANALNSSCSVAEKTGASKALMDVITESTSSVSSIPMAIKFVNEQREDLETVWNRLREGEARKYLSDILSLLSLMYFPESLLKYLLSGSDDCLTRWGNEFMRNCAIPIAKHYKAIRFGRNIRRALRQLGYEGTAKDSEDMSSEHSEEDVLLSVEKQISRCEFYFNIVIEINTKSGSFYDTLDILTEAGILDHSGEDGLFERWLEPILKTRPSFVLQTAVYLWDLNRHELARRVLGCVDGGSRRVSSRLHAALVIGDNKGARELLELCVSETVKAEEREKDEPDDDEEDDEGEAKPLRRYKSWKTELTNCLTFIGQQPTPFEFLSEASVLKLKGLREANFFIKIFTGAEYSAKVEERVTKQKLEEPETMEQLISEGFRPRGGSGGVQRQAKIQDILLKLPAASALMNGFANLGMKNDAHFAPLGQQLDVDEFIMTFSANENFRLVGAVMDGLLNYGRKRTDPTAALKDCCACLASKDASVRAGGFLQLGISLCGYKGEPFETREAYKSINIKQCCLSLLGPYANRLWYSSDRKNVVDWYMSETSHRDDQYVTNLPTISLFSNPDPNDLSDPYNLAYDGNNCCYPKVSRNEECCAMLALALIHMDTDDKFVKALLLDKLILVTKHKSHASYLDKFSRSLIPLCIALVSRCDTYVSDAIIRLQVGHSRNQASLKPHPYIASGLFALWMKQLPNHHISLPGHKSKLVVAREYCECLAQKVKNVYKPDSEREFNSVVSAVDVKEPDETSLLRYCAFAEAVIMSGGGYHADLNEPDGESAAMSHFSFLLKSISEATGGRRAAEEEGRRTKDREQNNAAEGKPKKPTSSPFSNKSPGSANKDTEDVESVVVEKDIGEDDEMLGGSGSPSQRQGHGTPRPGTGSEPDDWRATGVKANAHQELWAMKQLDPLTPLVLGLGMTFSTASGMNVLSPEDYKKELDRQHLKGINSHLTPMVARVLNKVLLLGTPQCRRAAPLALLFIPQDLTWTLDASDILVSLLGDSDLVTKLNALFALGCIHSGSKNPKILRLLRNTIETSNVPTVTFVCRLAIGLVACGRGCFQLTPSRVGTTESINNGSAAVMAALCMIMGVSWNSLATCDGVMLLTLLALSTSLKPLEAESAKKE